MKATELRIGNWIDSCVDLDTMEYVNEQVENATYLKFIEKNPKLVKPIPLTEEWLLKFGYQSIRELICDLLENSFIPIKENYNLIVDELDGIEVHQLQNLYFALTNEELIIKQ